MHVHMYVCLCLETLKAVLYFYSKYESLMTISYHFNKYSFMRRQTSQNIF